MRSCWLIYSQNTANNEATFTWMHQAATKYNIALHIIFAEEIQLLLHNVLLYRNQAIALPDFAYIRCYNAPLTNFLAASGVHCINSASAMSKAQNKWQTSELLRNAGIATPKTLYQKSYDFASVAQQLGTPFIIKPIDGMQGDGVQLITSAKELHHAVSTSHNNVIAQQFIATSFGKDIRVYVLGDTVIGAVMRQSHSDFRSNYSLGASVTAITLTDELIALALKVASALQIEFCGIDILFDEAGYSVCEVNGNAGFRTISAVTTIDMADIMFRYIAQIKKPY